MKKLPGEYLRRFTYDTIGHQINLDLVRLVGADRVLFGSDFPLLSQATSRRRVEEAGLDARPEAL